MSYELVTEKKEGYLLVTASGIRSFETVLAITKDVMSACAREEIKKALVDIRMLEGRLDTLESFMIPDQHFPKLRDRNILSRCAIIDLKQAEERFKFFENVCVNRGFFLRFFLDADKAVEWLAK